MLISNISQGQELLLQTQAAGSRRSIANGQRTNVEVTFLYSCEAIFYSHLESALSKNLSLEGVQVPG